LFLETFLRNVSKSKMSVSETFLTNGCDMEGHVAAGKGVDMTFKQYNSSPEVRADLGGRGVRTPSGAQKLVFDMLNFEISLGETTQTPLFQPRTPPNTISIRASYKNSRME
jgi:hypothetical protein